MRSCYSSFARTELFSCTVGCLAFGQARIVGNKQQAEWLLARSRDKGVLTRLPLRGKFVPRRCCLPATVAAYGSLLQDTVRFPPTLSAQFPIYATNLRASAEATQPCAGMSDGRPGEHGGARRIPHEHISAPCRHCGRRAAAEAAHTAPGLSFRNITYGHNNNLGGMRPPRHPMSGSTASLADPLKPGTALTGFSLNPDFAP